MSSSFIEGGGEFIDYRNPDKPFKTKSLKEWDEHLKKTGATVSGYGPCAICSKEVTYENLKYGTKPICDSCKQEALK